MKSHETNRITCPSCRKLVDVTEQINVYKEVWKKDIEDALEDYDLGWHEECYTISKKVWNTQIKQELTDKDENTKENK